LKRITLLLVAVMMFAGSLSAANHIDTKLQQLMKTAPNRKVKVIIQVDSAVLSGKGAKFWLQQGQQGQHGQQGQGQFFELLEDFKHLNGFAMKIKPADLNKLPDWHLIISIDEPLKFTSAADGLEPPNSSSGALAAFQKYAAAGTGVGVAIIDSGIASHPDLPNVVQTVDFTVPAGAPNVQTDPFGHGTHVAGIVAGSGQSSQGLYAGVAPSARLINLRVLDASGGGSTSNVISAIDWVIANRNALGNDGKPLNIRVINLSLGHAPYESSITDPLSVECRKAVQAGIVVVVSAGNNGKDPTTGLPAYGTITTPGIEQSVITVGSITTYGTPSRADDVVSSFSSKGPTIDHIAKPDIVAPGSRVVSTAAAGSYLVTTYPTFSVAPGYMKLSGTSMAAPAVTGAVAMMLSANPSLTPNLVKAILMYSAENKGDVVTAGAGEVNVVGAMDLAGAFNLNAAPGQYWLTNATVFATPSNVINGYTALWSNYIVWSGTRYGDHGGFMSYNRPIFGLTIVWDDTLVWDATIVWDQTIVWTAAIPPGTVLVCDVPVQAETIIWDESILWDEL
jgi:serine protease AprX